MSKNVNNDVSKDPPIESCFTWRLHPAVQPDTLCIQEPMLNKNKYFFVHFMFWWESWYSDLPFYIPQLPQLVKSLPLNITGALERHVFREEALGIGHYRQYLPQPPPLPLGLLATFPLTLPYFQSITDLTPLCCFSVGDCINLTKTMYQHFKISSVQGKKHIHSGRRHRDAKFTDNSQSQRDYLYNNLDQDLNKLMKHKQLH